MRSDIDWAQIVRNWFSNPQLFPNSLGTNENSEASAIKMQGSARMFFTDYAKKHKFNPLIPESWYSEVGNQISLEVRCRMKRLILIEYQEGSQKILSNYDYSFVKALVGSFPEVDFDRSKFTFVQSTLPPPSPPQKKSLKIFLEKYWTVDNRRRFFTEFAKTSGFNPHDPERWYGVSHHEIASAKV